MDYLPRSAFPYCCEPASSQFVLHPPHFTTPRRTYGTAPILFCLPAFPPCRCGAVTTFCVSTSYHHACGTCPCLRTSSFQGFGGMMAFPLLELVYFPSTLFPPGFHSYSPVFASMMDLQLSSTIYSLHLITTTPPTPFTFSLRPQFLFPVRAFYNHHPSFGLFHSAITVTLLLTPKLWDRTPPRISGFASYLQTRHRPHWPHSLGRH